MILFKKLIPFTVLDATVGTKLAPSVDVEHGYTGARLTKGTTFVLLFVVM